MSLYNVELSSVPELYTFLIPYFKRVFFV